MMPPSPASRPAAAAAAAPSTLPAPGAGAAGGGRSAALDAVRAVAVIAMVMGHTLDATLSPEARALPALQVYWMFRGVTAPLFLCVAGWALSGGLARAVGRGG